MLRWLRKRGFAWDARVTACARDGGHSAVVRWLVDSGCPDDLAPAAGRVEDIA
jgi:hypothetical protein